jgi:arginase
MNDRFILTPFFLDEPLLELEAVSSPGWVINRPEVQGSDSFERMTSTHLPLANIIESAFEVSDRPVSIAGDCCSSVAVLAALQRSEIAFHLLWLDAHGDFNTPETSPSGFVGGMPLAMLVGKGDQRLLEGVGAVPIDESQVTHCDGRDLDALEEKALLNSKINAVRDIKDLADSLPTNKPLWVHFDTDIVSSTEMPAHNYPATGGPTSAQVEETLNRLAQRGCVTAVSVSTWNPRLQAAQKSQQIAIRLLSALLDETS